MRVELYGLAMEAPSVTFYLWSPWRCTALEHKLFDCVRGVPHASVELTPDEHRIHVTDTKGWKAAVQNLARVLKGWQEEASDAGTERRVWRWLIETDVDASGYDMQGEKASFWAFVRVSLDRGGPGENDKGEDIDLNGFGVRVLGVNGE